MRTDRLASKFWLLAVMAGALTACSSSGGESGTGGATSSTVASGGSTGSSSSSAAAGSGGGSKTSSSSSTTAGSGGASAAGSSDHGGTTSTASSSGTGGKGGTGGSTGTGGGTGGRTGTGGTGTSSAGGAGGGSGGSTGGSSQADAGAQGDAMSPDASKPLGADASDASSTSTCPAGLAAPSAGNRKANLQHGGKSRSYVLHVPSGLSAGKPLAVVFDLHGASGNGSGQQGQSGWGNTADREKFLMVYPDGIDGYWNVDDTCCGTAGKQKIDDVGFIKAIIAQLSKDMCIDAKRIYATGWSNGGGLTHRLGCDAADVIAAIAPVATDLRTQPCKASRPISMMEIRGMADSLEPYEGGLVGPAGGQYMAVGGKASLKLWADINQCTGSTTTIDKYCETYTTCKDGVESSLCSLPGVDHSPYGNNLGFNVPDTAWKMFQRQAMK